MFNGKIAGVRLSDINPSVLSNLDSYNERLEAVNELIEYDEAVQTFLMEYMSTYRNVSPNMKEHLSEEDAVCNVLSIIATYLLSAKDIETERQVEYRFWKSIRDYRKSAEFKRTVNTSTLEGDKSNKEEDGRVDVIDMFYDTKSRNSKKSKTAWTITNKDIKKHKEIAELQGAIRELRSENMESKMKNHISSIIDSVEGEHEKAFLKRVLNNTKHYIRKYVADLKENQLAIKKAIERPVDFSNALKDDGFPIDWSKIDLANKKVFTELLENLNSRSISSNNELDLVVYDLHHFLLNGAGLSERELQVVKLFELGYKQSSGTTSITEAMGITKGALQNYINRIMQKVVKSGYTIE